MRPCQQHRSNTLGIFTGRTLLTALALLLVAGGSLRAQAQTFTVLHDFQKGSDGAVPYAGVTVDTEGRLYGTTTTDVTGNGAAYRMSRQGSGWVFMPLLHFGGINGQMPESRIVFGPGGILYGTTQQGGNLAGVAYSLGPPANFCGSFLCSWDETVLYVFNVADEFELDHGDLIFDPAGNIYGTAEDDGAFCGDPGGGGGGADGNVWELSKSGQSWTWKNLYTFTGSYDGAQPQSGVIRDVAGNLYGTTLTCGDPQCDHFGTVFELTSRAGLCWAEQSLHIFGGTDGKYPEAGLTVDANGNMYGATVEGGSNQGGTIFEMSPGSGGWTFQVLYNLTGGGNSVGPSRNLALDAAGNLYGTTYSEGAFGRGSVFKLSPGSGGWTYTSLHDFTGGNDGGYPLSNVSMDASGNLYGTTSSGGTGTECSGGCGVVWQITP
jgi:uncharacterized repeat protein (TIGR03803 family)